MSKVQNKMELAEKTAGSNFTLNNGFLGGKKAVHWIALKWPNFTNNALILFRNVIKAANH